MSAHGFGSRFRVAVRKSRHYPLVFPQRGCKTARGGKQPSNAIEPQPGALRRRFHARKVDRLKKYVVELKVEGVKARRVIHFHGGFLVAEVSPQSSERTGSELAGKVARHLRLQRPAEEHVLPHVCQPDNRDRGTALGPDLNQPFGFEPRKRLGDRKARDPQTLTNSSFINEFARLEIHRHNGLAQGVSDPLGRAGGFTSLSALQKTVALRAHIHANMLV